jgi:hypothetical protein
MVKRLLAPVDIAPLAYLRLVFGVVMAVEVGRFLGHGWVRADYIEPVFFFSYYGFSWVKPWPGAWMYVHFAAVGVAAAMVAVGLWYRAAAVILWAGFSYIFLLDQTHYLNHLYLTCLVAFLFVWLPAGSAYSADVRLGRTPRRDEVPAWMLWLLRAQIGLVYFFGGVAKLEVDWLSGVPGAMFLDNLELTAPLAEREWSARAFALAGLGFDLLVVPALLWRRTRPLAVAATVAFHLMNAALFRIGIFPWLMLFSTPIFFEPETVRRWMDRVWRGPKPSSRKPVEASPRWQRAGLAFFYAWMAVQTALPLRHWLYPGTANWTEEGHNFSWHMKLRVKRGQARFFARDPRTGEEWEVDVRLMLTDRQYRKMTTRPDLVLQLAHELARGYAEKEGRPGMEIRAEVHTSLNGRPPQPMVDSTVNLAAQPWTIWPSPWIVPFQGGPVRVSARDE